DALPIYVARVEAAHAVGEDVDRLAGRVAQDEVLELLGARGGPGGRAQAGYQDAVAGRLDGLDDAGEVTDDGVPADAHAAEAAQPVHEHDRAAQAWDPAGGHGGAP